jgi:hypothetical protein
MSAVHAPTLLSRKLFKITHKLLKLIAALAIIGLSNQPVSGYNTPAARGMPSPL